MRNYDADYGNADGQVFEKRNQLPDGMHRLRITGCSRGTVGDNMDKFSIDFIVEDITSPHNKIPCNHTILINPDNPKSISIGMNLLKNINNILNLNISPDQWLTEHVKAYNDYIVTAIKTESLKRNKSGDPYVNWQWCQLITNPHDNPDDIIPDTTPAPPADYEEEEIDLDDDDPFTED